MKTRRRWGPALLLGALLLMLLSLAAAGALLELLHTAGAGAPLLLDDSGHTTLQLDPDAGVLALLAVAAVCFVLLVLLLVALPVLLVLVLLGVALTVAAVLGSVLGSLMLVTAAVAILAALLLSPLWGMAMLLWWLLRRRASRPAPQGPAGSAASLA